MIRSIQKRDGRIVLYDQSKIAAAVLKALEAAHEGNAADAAVIANDVERDLDAEYQEKAPGIEVIQDLVEQKLMNHGFNNAAKAYILYRATRTRAREANTALMKTIDEITKVDARISDLKRENGNIDGNTAMGSMLQIGAAGAKAYNEMYLLRPEHAKAYRGGDIHIHDFDFYSLTTTCCQIDIIKLFKNGFSTGHGYLREPQSIQSYAALAAIAIQANQNDQHGGQSIPNFDYGMAEGVAKTYRKAFRKCMTDLIEDKLDLDDASDRVNAVVEAAEKAGGDNVRLENTPEFDARLAEGLMKEFSLTREQADADIRRVRGRASRIADKDTYQAMEGFVHNLNTMHSRAGAQTPFSSINYGTDVTPEGRMVIRNILMALDAGLGHGETCIFPIHIFKVKDGVNFNQGDPNYDLFRLSCKVSARRLFPNYVFLDAPYNLQYYKPGHPETEVAYMGCRTRVIGNRHDPSREITYGRGNLSFTSLNLPRLAILANKNIDFFFDQLDRTLDLCIEQILERFEIQCQKCVRNYPFLMGQGVWIDSDKLSIDDEVREVLKHGTLSIGFIGLAEALVALIGKHHGESEEAQRLGLEIVSFMRKKLDKQGEKTGLNFTCLATPAEGLSGRFVRIDRERYGKIPGVTDRDYYTNSFHVPVYYPINAFDKIKIEAPYHALTNAGHISYIELDGDPSENLEAFEQVVRCMKEEGIGYGSINHPVDRDPVCGYTGIIGDYCPKCGRKIVKNGEQVERIRRITGYLVGTLDRFNNAKKAEVHDRVKHSLDRADDLSFRDAV